MARTLAKTDELLTRLRPWLPTLRRLLPPERGASAVEPSVAWFGALSFFQPPMEEAEPLDHVCEALSLLALVARVDLAAWKIVLRKIWPRNERLLDWLRGPLPTDLAVGFDVMDLSDRWIQGIDRLRDHSTTRTGPSEAYTSVYEYLSSLRRSEEAGEDSWMKVRTRIELAARGVSSKDIVTMLQHTINLVVVARKEEEQTNAATRSQPRPHFAVCNVEFASTVGVKLDFDGLLSLQQLTWLGVQVSHLPPLTLQPSRDDAGIITQALRDLAGIDDSGNKENVGVGSISISDRFAQAPIEALAAAAQHSPTIHTVEIDLGNGREVWFPDQSHVWKWVAYSIFSRYADHNIKTLKLRLETFQDVEVEAVRDVLDAINPLAVLRRRIGQPPNFSAPRQLVASRFLFDDEYGTPAVPFETRSEIAVRVLDTPKGKIYPWWSVILPGHGEAFVRRDDVLSTSTTGVFNVNRQVATVPEFPHLHIVMSDDTSNAVADLIELIGQKTKRIDVDDDWGGLSVDEWCDRVLDACPELEELRIPNGCVEDACVFVAAAKASDRGLRVLNITVEAGDRAEGLQGLFLALTDPSHPLSVHMEDLTLDTVIHASNTSELIDLVVQMLRQNRQLLRFHLNVVPDSDPADLFPGFKAAIAELETQPVTIRTAPLGIREKLALLSVVDQKSHSGANPIGQLDASVLTTVLQFAATGQTRELRFTYGMDGDELVSSWPHTAKVNTITRWS